MVFKKSSLKLRAVFGNFLTLLENYRANSHVKFSIEKPVVGNPLYLSGHNLLQQKKIYEFRKVFEIFPKFLNFF